MSAPVIALVEVEWHAIDNPDQPGGGYPYYRRCDLCDRDASEDAVAGKRIEEFRRFWREMPIETTSGLTICEHCLDAYLSEPA